MHIQFLATVAVIAPDPLSSRSLCVEAMGLPLRGEDDGYHHSEQVDGCKPFGIWPLSQAGFDLLHDARVEPWGQTGARLQSPEGAIVGVSYAPVLHV